MAEAKQRVPENFNALYDPAARAAHPAVARLAGQVSDLAVDLKSADWPRFTESAGRARLMLREPPSLLDPRHLHVVEQKGNLFRREHPDVPVLLDKGRFLLVDMAPERVQELGAGDVSCYAVRPLEAAGAHEENRIVFAARSRTADRAAAGPSDPTMQALTARVSRASYEAALTRLAQFPTRHSTTSTSTWPWKSCA
jgi:hypothetical protein